MKIKIFVITLFCSVVCFAENQCDIIVTQKAERIEALITEITPTEVKYHKFSNPTGPLFVLYAKDIAAIIYKNGEVQMFKQEKKSSSLVTDTTSSRVKVAAQKESDVKLPYLTLKKVKVEGKKRPKTRYCSNDNSVVMTENEFVSLIQSNCPEAYSQYKKSSRLLLAGALLTWLPPVGLILDLIAISQSEEILPIYNNQCAIWRNNRR